MPILIVENTFTTQPMHQAYIEPHSCVVQATASGGADVWACSKVPFALREQVATAFRRPAGDFLMHPCYIGGCFGGKGDFMDVPVCYLLSLKSGRPVKMVMDYSEEFIAGNPRHAAVIKVKTGVKKDGRWSRTGWNMSTTAAPTARSSRKVIWSGPKEAAGPYKIPNVFINEKIVYTNKIPCGHMRAPGEPQGFFANESQMDLVARRLGMDPVAFRRKNLMHDGDISPIGHVVPHIKSDEILAQAIRLRVTTSPSANRSAAAWRWRSGCRWAAKGMRLSRSMRDGEDHRVDRDGRSGGRHLYGDAPDRRQRTASAGGRSSLRDSRHQPRRRGYRRRRQPGDANLRQFDSRCRAASQGQVAQGASEIARCATDEAYVHGRGRDSRDATASR